MPPKVPTAIRQQAVRAADKRAMPSELIRWSDALAEAPTTLDGQAYEVEFRRIYAARLVTRGIAAKAHRAGKSSGPSGKTDLERKTVYLSRLEIVAQEAKAEKAALSWSTWARRKLSK